VEGSDSEDVVLTFTLRVRRTATDSAENWIVSLPVGRQDLSPAVRSESLILTLRANLEEWWDLKDHDPRVRASGRRLPH